MSEATQVPSLEDTLNKTDLGHMLYDHRKTIFGTILAIFIAVIGYFTWKQTRESAALENSVTVFEFQSKTWNEAREGKMTTEALVEAFSQLDSSVQTAPVMVPVVLEMGKFLYEKEKYAQANTILSKISGKVKHPVASLFVSMQHAVVLEKLGNLDEAIAVMETLAKGQQGLMAAKVSLELGRLHLQKGNTNEARTQFDHIINTYPNEEEAKMARLYLSQITQ